MAADLSLPLEVVRRLFPEDVAVAVCHGANEAEPLLESELALLSPRAVAKRRQQLRMGRSAARAALRALGTEAAAIGRGPGGEPLWPAGVIGAITHTEEVAAAAVAWRAEYEGIGLDIEAARAVSEQVGELVLSPTELAWSGEADPALRRTMLFSAKEAIFKATNPIDHVWLDFSNAELEWQPPQAAFRATLLKAVSERHPAGTVLAVRCAVTHGLVLTGTVLATAHNPRE